MDRERYLKFKLFVQRITDKPAPIESQPFKAADGFRWCEDWELIELGKFFFLGKDVYLNDPPPRRLKGNPLFDQQAIVKQAEELTQKHNGNADAIIAELEGRRHAYV